MLLNFIFGKFSLIACVVKRLHRAIQQENYRILFMKFHAIVKVQSPNMEGSTLIIIPSEMSIKNF